MDDEQATLPMPEPSTEARHGTLLVLLLHARLKRFPDQLRAKLLEWIQDIPKDELEDPNQVLEQLCVVARIGAVQPDQEIANAAVHLALDVVKRKKSAELASLAWLCIVFAAGAYVEKEARDDWLERQLLGLALTLPKGTPCVDPNDARNAKRLA
jgi:hypothetical protein